MSSRFAWSIASGPERSAEVLVLYDRDCGVCTWTMRLLGRLDAGGRLVPVPLQEAHEAIEDAPPLEMLLATIHVRAPAGRWSTGGAACARIMCAIPMLRPFGLLASTPPVARLVDAGYRLVARNRHRIGRRLGVEACVMDERR